MYYLLLPVGKVATLAHCESLAETHTQLGYETYKARKVIRSRDISYAFTNVMANNYYSIRMSIVLAAHAETLTRF